MGQIFAIIGILNNYLPFIVQTIHGVEAMMPGSGNGPSKLKMLLSIIEEAHNAASGALQSTGINFNMIVPAITKIVSIMVSFFNTKGWGNSTPVVTAPPAPTSAPIYKVPEFIAPTVTPVSVAVQSPFGPPVAVDNTVNQTTFPLPPEGVRNSPFAIGPGPLDYPAPTESPFNSSLA
jgi:hypothetical protein